MRKAVGGPEGAWLDTDIFTEVMNRMVRRSRVRARPRSWMIASVTPTYGGMSHARLTATRRLRLWRAQAPSIPARPSAHAKLAKGLGAFSTPDYQPSAELPDAEYPLVMMTGRILYQYNALRYDRSQ